MKRREFIRLVAGASLACPGLSHAQQTGALKRIGLLRVGPLPKEWGAGLRQGLREHGLVEGQQYSIELGVVEHAAEIPEVLAQLVRRKVDVIVASGVPSVLPARDGAGTIPVVFIFSGDPVAIGLAASLAKPGGNLTGVTVMDSAVTAKRFQLLKELVPGLSKAALVLRTRGPENDRYIEETRRAERDLGFQVQILTLQDADELPRALDSARDVRALAIVADAQFTVARARIAQLAVKRRLPTIFTHRAMVEAGGLISYGPVYEELYRQAADHVQKILQGARPGDLPIEQPAKYEQVINLKTAKALGLTIPASIQLRADHVIG
jgi:putative ABC transport system substrate-binding protein